MGGAYHGSSMNTPTPTAPPLDLTESAAGEEDPGAGIEIPAETGASSSGVPQQPVDQKDKPSLRRPA